MTDEEALKRLGRLIARSRDTRARIMEEAADTARTVHANGMPETEIARTLGVNRTTIRKWLGK